MSIKVTIEFDSNYEMQDALSSLRENPEREAVVRAQTSYENANNRMLDAQSEARNLRYELDQKQVVIERLRMQVMRQQEQAPDTKGRFAEILEEIAAGRKINAIKLAREHTGQGLKESKDFVETLALFNLTPAPAKVENFCGTKEPKAS